MTEPQRASQYPDKSLVIKSVFNVLWRYWLLVCILVMLPSAVNEENFCARIVSSFITGGLLFIAISAWSEWYYNKYGLKSVTWHNELHLIDGRKGDDND